MRKPSSDPSRSASPESGQCRHDDRADDRRDEEGNQEEARILALPTARRHERRFGIFSIGPGHPPMRRRSPVRNRSVAPHPASHAERRSGSPTFSRLLAELRRKSVHVHLVVLVVRPWSDGAFNHLTHGVDRFAFSDADAQFVIVSSCMDWQCNVRRKPSFECLGLGGLKARSGAAVRRPVASAFCLAGTETGTRPRRGSRAFQATHRRAPSPGPRPRTASRP
jgi:hypothetical protein